MGMEFCSLPSIPFPSSIPLLPFVSLSCPVYCFPDMHLVDSGSAYVVGEPPAGQAFGSTGLGICAQTEARRLLLSRIFSIAVH